MQSPIRAASSARSLPLSTAPPRQATTALPKKPRVARNQRPARIYKDNCGEVTAARRLGPPTTPLPAGGQGLQAAQHERGPPFRVVGVVELEPGQPPQQRRDRHFGLDARKLGAEAEVDATAERQRAHIGPRDVEMIRPVRIDRRVPVGGAEQAELALPFRNALATEIIDVFQRYPPGHLDRR